MGELHKLLKTQREALGLTQEQLAKKVGVAPVYISQLERGIRETPSDDLCRRLAKALDLEAGRLFKLVYQDRLPAELRHLFGAKGGKGAVQPLPARRVPVLNRSSCNRWRDFGDMDFPAGHADSDEPADTRDPNAFYIVAEGDSMIGFDIQEGDYLLVEPGIQVENGDIVLAIHPDEGTTVKRFYRMADGGIILRPGNDRYPPILVKEGDDRFRVFLISEIKKKTRRRRKRK